MDTKRLEELALTGIIYEQAVDNQGIYPMKVSGGSNPYEKRTDKMEGHNDCMTSIARDVVRFEEFIAKHEFKEDIKTALFEGWISIQSKNKEELILSVNTNDLFYWAVADSEEIQPNELVDLFRCYKETNFGGFLWACRKNKMRPQSPWYDSFDPQEKELFDACGPERDKADEG